MIVRFIRKWITRLVALGVLGGAIVLILGFLGALHPALDTLSHLRVHLAVCILGAGLLLTFSRFRRFGYCGLLAGFIGVASATVFFPASAVVQERIADKPVYSLYHLNLLWNHSEPSSVIEEILTRNPELITLSEASLEWALHLKRLDANWPYLFNCPEFGPRGGVRIYSKWPMDRLDDYCGVYGSIGKTTVNVPSAGNLEVVTVHFRWPWPASGPAQLRSALPRIRALGQDVLVAGDFNATPWSNAFKKFTSSGKLEIATGIGPTWLFTEFPSSFIRWIGFPIDNVAHKGRIRVLSTESLPPVGSDHLPVLVKFQID